MGSEIWDTLDPADYLPPDEAKQYIKSVDILDVWFDSGVTHETVLSSADSTFFPAALYLEGSDQYRGWFQSSLLTALAMNKGTPYQAVITHGFVVDAAGRKMAKSLGNVIAPEEVTDTSGADILRLWAASTDYRTEIVISQEILDRTSEIYRRIRNTARFLLANLNDFDPEIHLVQPRFMLALDVWMAGYTRTLQEEILTDFAEYQFHQVVQKIHHFCAVTLGGFYLDIIKDRQYTLQKNSLARRSAQSAIYWILEAFVRWIAPVLSFTADEIWRYMPGSREQSVFLTHFAEIPQMFFPETIMNEKYWATIRTVRDAVNGQLEGERKKGNIGSALEARVQLFCSPVLKTQLDLLQQELRFVLLTSDAEVFSLTEKEKLFTADAILTEIPDFFVKVIPLQDAKCVRCWHRSAAIGINKLHPALCPRCIENIAGKGEVRKFA